MTYEHKDHEQEEEHDEEQQAISDEVGADVYNAYVELFEEPDNVDEINEAYEGQFESDEEMAQHMADSCYTIPDHWPYTCIDWEQAADDLMHDYYEDNGHYFRAC